MNYALTAKIAIIIPIFKHSGLLPETVTTALRQKVAVDFCIVFVNDGCPFEETDIACRQYAMAYPGKVFYLHKPNGGLSSARNAGIDFAINTFPELEAIYLMDADNRIGPRLLQKSYDTLFSAPAHIGWAYPDIDKFGIEEYCDVSGRYNIFEHMLWNFCEAGSLVKREVFDKGLRYDENMKLGYEDWEFWLQCIEAGYEGIHVADSGFKYRQRGESMLKDSERHHEEIMSYIKKKHSNLFNLNKFFGKEHDYCPRFAIYFSDTRHFTYTSDVNKDGLVKNYTDFIADFLANLVKHEVGRCPPYLVVTTSRYFHLLQCFKVLPGLLLHMQHDLDKATIAQLAVEVRQRDAIQLSFTPESSEAKPPAFVMCKLSDLEHVLNDEDWSWLSPNEASQSQSQASCAEIALEANVCPPAPTNALKSLINIVEDLRNDNKSALKDFQSATSVQHFRKHIAAPEIYYSRLFHLRHTLPITRSQHGLNIGILLPVAHFGGVEKVAFNYAEVLRLNGHQLHLFVVGKQTAHIPSVFANTFSSITFFADSELGKYASSTSNRDYLGSPLPTWNENGNVTHAVGMLAGMNAVINFNAAEFNSVMANIRKLGVRTYSSQHLIDRSPFNQPQGTPHQFLAYEHAYDGVLVISRQLYAWFQAQGVPSAKLLHVPNAASYPLEEHTRRRILDERLNRNSNELRVLYIGRFDRQKGLDRLAAVIERTQEMGLPIEWRIVGKAILGDENGSMKTLQPYLHPVAMKSEQLNQHFAWANVMIMVSRFEGVPLTILEAGRLGCAILTTNVGAIEEEFEDGVTGYLFDSEQDEATLIDQMCSRLQTLCHDKSLLDSLQKGAADYYGRIRWEQSMTPLLEKFSALAREI